MKISKSSRVERSSLVVKVLTSNVDRLILIGLGLGLIFGLGLGVAGNFMVRYIIHSYQGFVQHSLLGLNGSLVFEANSPELAGRLATKLGETNSGLQYSLRWESAGSIPIEFQQMGIKAPKQAKIIILEEAYLRAKLAKSSNCKLPESAPRIAFANGLMMSSLVGFDLQSDMSIIATPLQQPKGIPIHIYCPIDTGMTTDYPIIFLSFESLGFDKNKWGDKLEVFTSNRLETSHWQNRINQEIKPVITGVSDNIKDNNMFESDKMEFARAIAEQAESFSLAIAGVTVTLSMVILTLSFSLLFRFKKKVLFRLWCLGISKRTMLLGFALPGLVLGEVAALSGIFFAWVVKLVIEVFHIIPFEGFFTNWPWDISLLLVVTMPLIVGVYSGSSAAYWMHQHGSKNEAF